MESLNSKSIIVYLDIREVTQFNQAEIIEEILKIIYENNIIILDMSKINYLDSAGLGEIVSIFKIARLRGNRIGLINVKDHLLDLIHLFRLERILL